MQMGSLGFPELLVILFVVLLLFGPKRLPEVSRGLGKAVRDFRKGLDSGLEDVHESKPAAQAARPDTEPAAGGDEPVAVEATPGPSGAHDAAAAASVAAPSATDGPEEPSRDPPVRAS